MAETKARPSKKDSANKLQPNNKVTRKKAKPNKASANRKTGAGKRKGSPNSFKRSELTEIREQLPKTITLVGLMGAGKTCIGKLLAKSLKLNFVDADHEVERAAGMTISEIFETHGEAAFRDGERRVIQRLLDGPVQILSTGGGAFMDEQTRATMIEHSIVIWLKADLDVLVERTSRRNHRPLLRNGNHREILSDLMDKRYPVYSQAHVPVESADGAPELTRDKALQALIDYLQDETKKQQTTPKEPS
ncbi:shikimate kinase [Kiloniella sp. b19]|uniref:shikimate kinase n=1 Tax=Kiloniella sp. GXU_MW_B19 TaxID=3141326 RepID=UPI0031DD82F3